jgi:hypothetical protein
MKASKSHRPDITLLGEYLALFHCGRTLTPSISCQKRETRAEQKIQREI